MHKTTQYIPMNDDKNYVFSFFGRNMAQGDLIAIADQLNNLDIKNVALNIVARKRDLPKHFSSHTGDGTHDRLLIVRCYHEADRAEMKESIDRMMKEDLEHFDEPIANMFFAETVCRVTETSH